MEMEKIGIITDEAADLPRQIIEEEQIAVVPVKLDWPEIENLPGENTFQKMRELEKRGIKSFGKTSQPSPKDFLDRYNDYLARFEKIICITLTSKLSGTYNSAVNARNFLKPEDQKRIFTIDSSTVSSGQALLVLKTIDLVKSGKSAEEIVKELENFVPQIRSFVLLEDVKWVEVAGRISPLVAKLMKQLAKVGIRPLLTFKEGVLAPAGLKTNAKDMVLALFRQFGKENEKTEEGSKKIRVVITHGDAPEEAQRLKEMIEQGFKNAEVVFVNIVNNVVGSLAGPGAITISWCEA